MSLKDFHAPFIQKAAVAVSGGSDSLALALLLHGYIKDLMALIVDHKLRPESTQEALNVQKQLNIAGIETHILTLNKTSFYDENSATLKGDLQKRARTKRYEVLHKWCLENNCRDLFLGHHHGDQQETILMRFRQNSGLLGMGGIREKAHFKGITLHRPLLAHTKEQLQDYLRTQNMSWITDPSNKNEKFERIFWRHYLEKNDSILKSTQAFQKVRHAFEGWITRFLKQYAIQFSSASLGYLSLDHNTFLKLPPAFQIILVSHILVNYGVGDHPPSNDALMKLIEKLTSKHMPPQTLKGCRISLKQGKIMVAREYKRLKETALLSTGPYLFDERFLCHTPDDEKTYTLHPIGEKNWRNIVQQHPFLKEHPAPRYALWSLPLLKKNADIYLPSCLAKHIKNQSIKTFPCTFIGKSPF